MPSTSHPPPSVTIRTPHLATLVAALVARDLPAEVLGPDRVKVVDIAPDDLGWIVAASGVVVYEMVPEA